MNSRFLLLLTVPLMLLTACGNPSASRAPEDPASGGIRPVAVELKSINADSYIPALLGGPDNLRALADTTDLTGINFSGTFLAELPISETFLDENGYIKPDHVPTISAALAMTMIIPDDAELALLAERYQADITATFSPYAKEAFALNFADKYVFEVEVPSVGVIAYIDASAQSVNDLENGSIVYADSPVVNPLDEPQVIAQLSPGSTIAMPSLPKIFSKIRTTTTADSRGILYWFPSNLNEKEPYHIVRHIDGNRFVDIKSGASYAFNESMKISGQRVNGEVTVTFNSKRGFMEKINE